MCMTTETTTRERAVQEILDRAKLYAGILDGWGPRPRQRVPLGRQASNLGENLCILFEHCFNELAPEDQQFVLAQASRLLKNYILAERIRSQGKAVVQECGIEADVLGPTEPPEYWLVPQRQA
jgi:hypothetical protein